MLAQPVNLLRPRFLRMLADIRRFYRDARALDPADAGLTAAEFVERNGYGRGFLEDHLLPMCAALWSQPNEQVRSIAIDTLPALEKSAAMAGREPSSIAAEAARHDTSDRTVLFILQLSSR